jgi:hypothetical protein
MMKKKIYIHIGWHKTGTTSIQDFLLKNRTKLINQEKIYYPSEGMLVCAHHTIAWAFQNKKTSPWGAIEIPNGGAEKFIENIRTSADSQECETVIMSSEEFCTFKRNEIQALHAALEKNNFETKIIGYIRRQDQMIESAYNMEVKWWGSRLTKNFSDYLKIRSQLIKYTPVIEEWASVFGLNNTIIRHFSQEKLDGNDIRIDFGNALKIDLKNLEISTERVNDSLATQTLEFVRIINNLNLTRKLNGEIVEKLFEYDKSEKLPKCVFFTPDERISYMASLDGANKALKKFTYDIDFALPPKETLPERNVRPLTIEEFNKIFQFVFEDRADTQQ